MTEFADTRRLAPDDRSSPFVAFVQRRGRRGRHSYGVGQVHVVPAELAYDEYGRIQPGMSADAVAVIALATEDGVIARLRENGWEEDGDAFMHQGFGVVGVRPAQGGADLVPVEAIDRALDLGLQIGPPRQAPSTKESQ